MRTRAERRHNTRVKSNKKANIVKNVYFEGQDLVENERFVGKLKKGKIHCSCYMCATKTKKDGWKHSDRKHMSE